MDLFSSMLNMMTASKNEADYTKSVYKDMINIVDQAPPLKVADIVQHNQYQINKVLAKLLILSININEDTTSLNQCGTNDQNSELN